MTKSVTYRRLDQLLSALGFARDQHEENCSIYRHGESRALILVAKRAPADSILDADLLSVRRHLVDGGLMGENEFDDFAATGTVPLSS